MTHESATVAAHCLVDGIAHCQPAYARAPRRDEDWPRTRASLLLAWRDHEREQLVMAALASGQLAVLEPRWWNRGRHAVECATTDALLAEVLADRDEDELVVTPRDSLIEREGPPCPIEELAMLISRMT